MKTMIKNNLLTRSCLDRKGEKEQRQRLKTQNNSLVLEHNILTSVKKSRKTKMLSKKWMEWQNDKYWIYMGVKQQRKV